MVEVDFACCELLLQNIRQRVCIDLEADGQRGFWRDARADTAVLLAGNGFMQLKRVTPERLAPECLIAEGLSAFHRASSVRLARSLHRSLSWTEGSGSNDGQKQADSAKKCSDRDSDIHFRLPSKDVL
jgi:hypothetical protein